MKVRHKPGVNKDRRSKGRLFCCCGGEELTPCLRQAGKPRFCKYPIPIVAKGFHP